MRPNYSIATGLFLAAALLVGCGRNGPLYLPDSVKTPPLTSTTPPPSDRAPD